MTAQRRHERVGYSRHLSVISDTAGGSMKFYIQRADGRYYKWSNKGLDVSWVKSQGEATWWSESGARTMARVYADVQVVQGDPLVELLEQQEWQ